MLYSSEKIEAFGLDFSDLSLKAIKLKKKGKGLSLSSFGKIDLPEGIIEGGEVKDEKQLSEYIKELLNKLKGDKIKTKYVVSSLPEEKSFLDVLLLPQIKDKELETAIMFEAENYIPIPLGDVYFDFEKKNSENKNQKLQEILIAATPKKIVDSYVSSMKKAGLFPVACEIESFAIARALVGRQEKSPSLLIADFGEAKTSFIVFSENGIRFTSSSSISSQLITKTISQAFKVSIEEAEAMKIKSGVESDQKLSKSISPILSELSSQIQNHLGYFCSSNAKNKFPENKKIEKILICGGGANLKGLTTFLSKSLSIKVELGNPWINILDYPLKEVPLISFEDSLGFVSALGLALRGVDKRKSNL